MKYKFITIEKCEAKNQKDFEEMYWGRLLEPNFKKKVYVVLNNKSNNLIAVIHYYPRWRKYVWESDNAVLWDEKCLQIIIDFLKDLNGKKEKVNE